VIRTLQPTDPEYPTRLLELHDRPAMLWVDGVLPDPSRPMVALVGTRKASAHGRDAAARLAGDLARAGVVIVSGGALGIDAAAHRGALAVGGTTLVVLPTGIERPHPAGHRRLFREIVEAGGACLTERAPDEPIGKWCFVARNRLVAALASWIVVVEARARSGTRATVDAARRLGRPLAAVPWRTIDPAEGGLELLREGALPVIGARDILDRLGIAAADPIARAPIPALLAERGPLTAEAIARALDLALVEVLGQLTTLEIEGTLALEPGGRYRLGTRG